MLLSVFPPDSLSNPCDLRQVHAKVRLVRRILCMVTAFSLALKGTPLLCLHEDPQHQTALGYAHCERSQGRR